VVDIPTDRIGAAIDVTYIPPESESDFPPIPLWKKIRSWKFKVLFNYRTGRTDMIENVYW
jgi:hypothetical protein